MNKLSKCTKLEKGQIVSFGPGCCSGNRLINQETKVGKIIGIQGPKQGFYKSNYYHIEIENSSQVVMFVPENSINSVTEKTE